MNANTAIQPSAFMKKWVEETLGFGRPFNIESSTALFKNMSKGLTYSTNNSAATASIGIMSSAEWNVTHGNELGTVFYDLSEGVMNRVRTHINKTLGSDGFQVESFTADTKSMVMISNMLVTLDGVERRYRADVTNDVTVRTSLSVRKHGREYNLVFRVLFESDVESVYVSIVSANVIATVRLNITMQQVERVTRIGRVSLDCFDNHNGLFRQFGPVDIAHKLATIAFSAATAGVQGIKFEMGTSLSDAYTKFREEALANRDLSVSLGENHTVFTAEQLVYLEELEDITTEPVALRVLGFVVNLMVEQINETLAHNHEMKV